MSAETNREIGRKFFEAQDRLRGGPDPDLCAPNYVARLGSVPPMTFADHQGFAKVFYAGFPDLSHTIDAIVAADDAVVVRFRLLGTHRGDFMGIPPTQKAIEVGAIAIFSITGGRITEAHGQFDQLGMMRQLGVIP
jgi:hypothetical protein